MLKKLEIDLTYQRIIQGPPQNPQGLHAQAASSDDITVKTWKDTWIKNYELAKARFGSFADKSIGKLYGMNRFKPAIICGSGPSLKNSVEALKQNAAQDHPVLTISCLHNFGFFEDEGFHADYYLSLDSGKIVVGDVTESRKENADYYWEKTKGKKLLATVASDPELFDKWQGEIYLFNSLIPDEEIRKKYDEIERFSHYVSAGGNALGGCLYVAKAIFGSDVVMLVGADFCFDYNNQFHSYQTHYDSLGQYVMWPDVFGIPRKTWQSYLNFKFWFDWMACTVPGRYVNCSEGLMGAYPEGNIQQFQYMPLKDALLPYRIHQQVIRQTVNEAGELQGEGPVRWKEIFADSKYAEDVLLF